MRKDASLPVRLDLGEKRRLKIAAERMGLTVSALIRLLVRSFIDDYDRHGGRVALPLDWQKTFDSVPLDAQRVAEASAPYMSHGTAHSKKQH